MACNCGCGGSSSPVLRTQAKQRRRLVDPSRTTALRKDYEREFVKRWNRVIKQIVQSVVKRNDFALATNAKYEFATTQEKVSSFTAWFDDAVNKALFGSDLSRDFDTAAQRFWGNSFANIAYRRGLLKSVADIRRAGGRVADTYVSSAMARGQHAETIKRLYTRQFDDLRGITRETSRQIGEVLAQGLSEGRGPFEIAALLTDRVDKIGKTRSKLLARTELISAFNEAELNSYDDANVQGVELSPELLTAGDDRVCQQCEDAADREWTVETARGVIPLHPNCRCAWLPLIANGREIELT